MAGDDGGVAGVRAAALVGEVAQRVPHPALAGGFGAQYDLGQPQVGYPLVEVQVATSPTGSTGLADDVRHGRLDVALLGLPKLELSGLEVRDLATVPFVALTVLAETSHNPSSVPQQDVITLCQSRTVWALPIHIEINSFSVASPSFVPVRPLNK